MLDLILDRNFVWNLMFYAMYNCEYYLFINFTVRFIMEFKVELILFLFIEFKLNSIAFMKQEL